MPTSQSKKNEIIPHLALTFGDPAGIGPEIILKSLIKLKARKLCSFSVIGDYSVISRMAEVLKVSISNLFRDESLNFINVGKIAQRNFRFGRLSPICGIAAIRYIEKAVGLIKDKKIDLLVTAPVNKQAINEGGFKFSGHTEYLARLTKTKNFAMMLIGGRLRVVPLTRHLPLKEVSRRISTLGICRAVELADRSLKKYFDIQSPRIGVCGLNPHAGEGGVLGDEEKKIIAPAVNKLVKKGLVVSGPFPADTLFYQAYEGKYDLLLSMYHDQGLVPLKMIAFDRGVNVTLGLPFIRTSPDHGTALDIAGLGIANPRSMIEAIKLAVRIWQKKS